MNDNEYQLRLLLAMSYTGNGLYLDDGEIQDNTRLPLIDFKRDTVSDIKEKMRERLMNTLKGERQ